MQFSTRSALVALLLSTDAMAEHCGKGKFKNTPSTLRTSFVPTSSAVPVPKTPLTVVVSTSSSVAVAHPSTTSSSAAAATTTAAASSGLTSDQQGALDVQNSARSAVGEAALAWDAGLAGDAQTWADHLASTYGSSGTLEHEGAAGEGENLYWQSNSPTPFTNGANGWVAEKSSYSGESIGEGDFESFGHYTQIIWKSTTKVGMAVASDGGGGFYVVARYSPQGNVEGEVPISS